MIYTCHQPAHGQIISSWSALYSSLPSAMALPARHKYTDSGHVLPAAAPQQVHKQERRMNSLASNHTFGSPRSGNSVAQRQFDRTCSGHNFSPTAGCRWSSRVALPDWKRAREGESMDLLICLDQSQLEAANTSCPVRYPSIAPQTYRCLRRRPGQASAGECLHQ